MVDISFSISAHMVTTLTKKGEQVFPHFVYLFLSFLLRWIIEFPSLTLIKRFICIQSLLLYQCLHKATFFTKYYMKQFLHDDGFFQHLIYR